MVNQPLYILRKKCKLGPVCHGHIANLPLSLIKFTIVLIMHAESGHGVLTFGTPILHLLLKFISTFAVTMHSLYILSKHN